MEIRQKNCEVCKKDAATCLCFQCMSYFCESCFKLAHSTEEYLLHKKEKIDYYVPIDIKCPEHKLHPMCLFCINEKGKILNYLIFLINRIMLCILSF